MQNLSNSLLYQTPLLITMIRLQNLTVNKLNFNKFFKFEKFSSWVNEIQYLLLVLYWKSTIVLNLLYLDHHALATFHFSLSPSFSLYVVHSFSLCFHPFICYIYLELPICLERMSLTIDRYLVLFGFG